MTKPVIWTLADVQRLWEQYRVVSDFTGMEVKGVHAFIDMQLKLIQTLKSERSEWKQRAMRAESRLDDIAQAITSHMEDKNV